MNEIYLNGGDVKLVSYSAEIYQFYNNSFVNIFFSQIREILFTCGTFIAFRGCEESMLVILQLKEQEALEVDESGRISMIDKVLAESEKYKIFEMSNGDK